MSDIKGNAKLCLLLMRADTVEQVMAILRDAGYWDDPASWRPFADDENNFAPIGNQQSEGIAALVEKIVNSVDARLVDACLRAGIDPESSDAPQTMIEAVARFFDAGPHNPSSAGRVSEWEDSEATRQARLLTVAASGLMPEQGNPSISIADQGEGQTPGRVPETFMSIGRSNKLRIPFVQGKFNMGGTGALLFSGGDTGLQLVVTRRDPALLGPGASEEDRRWSFTVVRREEPRKGARSSIYTYLAPVGAESGAIGSVLTFDADEWPIFPEADAVVRAPHTRNAPYGSLVKLYEYDWRGSKSNIVMTGNGLLRRIDVGLPELALPVRLYECRPSYKGDAQSFSTNALGVVARLGRDRAGNLENDGVIGAGVTIAGRKLPVRIYVFRAGRAQQYKSAQQGVIYSVNGQTHAMHGIEFFRRRAVNLTYLAEDLLVVVDCSSIEGRLRENIFMNSRDRLRDRTAARELESALEKVLRDDPTLKVLANQRRAQAIADRLSDDKPLADILQGLIKANPMLQKLLLAGVQIPAPFPPGGGTRKGEKKAFVGKRYPTFFRIKGHEDGSTHARQVALGSTARLAFETDAEDEYFTRVDEPGALNVTAEVDGTPCSDEIDWSWNGPRDGVLYLSVALPPTIAVASVFRATIEVIDPVQTVPFSSSVALSVVPPAPPGGGGGAPNPPKIETNGRGSKGTGSAMALPHVVEVHEEKWTEYGFTDESALMVRSTTESRVGSESHDFFINVDNKFLKSVQKQSREDPKLIEKQFTYGFVILGLAMLQDIRRHPTLASGIERDAESEIRQFSRAVAPVLVPMLQSIGDLSELDT